MSNKNSLSEGLSGIFEVRASDLEHLVNTITEDFSDEEISEILKEQNIEQRVLEHKHTHGLLIDHVYNNLSLTEIIDVETIQEEIAIQILQSIQLNQLDISDTKHVKTLIDDALDVEGRNGHTPIIIPSELIIEMTNFLKQLFYKDEEIDLGSGQVYMNKLKEDYENGQEILDYIKDSFLKQTQLTYGQGQYPRIGISVRKLMNPNG